MKNYEKDLYEFLKSLLKNSKFEILHLAYRYNKKSYANQNWLKIKLLDEWGILIDPKKSYLTMRDIQNELLSIDFLELFPYMEFIYKSVRRICGDYIFTQNKYKQLRLAYFKFDNYYKNLYDDSKGFEDLIQWIKEIDVPLYGDITNDSNWPNNFLIHINKVHTAFHTLLLNCAKSTEYSPVANESITSLYKNIYSNFEESDTAILKTDGYLVKKLNDLRNKSSKAHPNDSAPTISKDIGLSFLFKIKNLVEEIKMNF